MSYNFQDKWKMNQQPMYGDGRIIPAPYLAPSPFAQAVEDGRLPPPGQSSHDWPRTEEDYDLLRQALAEFVPEEGPNGVPGGTAHPYAASMQQWEALKADAAQLGMATSYGMPTEQYYQYKGGKPDWLIRADEADMQRTLAENPPMASAQQDYLSLARNTAPVEWWKLKELPRLDPVEELYGAGSLSFPNKEEATQPPQVVEQVKGSPMDVHNRSVSAFMSRIQNATTLNELDALEREILKTVKVDLWLINTRNPAWLPSYNPIQIDADRKRLLDTINQKRNGIKEPVYALYPSAYEKADKERDEADSTAWADAKSRIDVLAAEEVSLRDEIDSISRAGMQGVPINDARIAEIQKRLEEIGAEKDNILNQYYTSTADTFISNTAYQQNLTMEREDARLGISQTLAQYIAQELGVMEASETMPIFFKDGKRIWTSPLFIEKPEGMTDREWATELLRQLKEAYQEEFNKHSQYFDVMTHGKGYLKKVFSRDPYGEWLQQYLESEYKLNDVLYQELQLAPDFVDVVSAAETDAGNRIREPVIGMDFTLAGSGGVMLNKDLYLNAKFMYPNEKGIYLYNLGKYGKEVADKYLDSIKESVKVRAAIAQDATYRKMPLAGRMLNRILMGPAADAIGFFTSQYNAAANIDTTWADPGYAALRANEQATQDLLEKIPEGILRTTAGATLSAVDVAYVTVLLGPEAIAPVLSMKSAASAALEAEYAGADSYTVSNMAVTYGLTSYLIESLGTGERITQFLENPTSVGSFITAFAKGTISEGIEEIIERKVNNAENAYYLKENSAYNKTLTSFRENGYSGTAAIAAAEVAELLSTVEDGLAGMIAGGMLTGWAYTKGQRSAQATAQVLQDRFPGMPEDVALSAAKAMLDIEAPSPEFVDEFNRYIDTETALLTQEPGRDESTVPDAFHDGEVEVNADAADAVQTDVQADAISGEADAGYDAGYDAEVSNPELQPEQEFDYTPAYEVPVLLGGNEEATVIGIQGVGECATVRTDDGRVIPIGEVDFGDFETQGLYKIAAEFPDSATANLFLQIYRDSEVDVPEFLQVYLDVYQKDVQSRTDVTEDGPDSLPELPFDVKDVAPYGSLDFSEESLDTINELFEQEGLPLPEGLESKQNDEDVALSDESVIMESSVAQEEDGSGDEDEDDPNRQPPEGVGDVKKYFENEQLKTEPNTAYFWSGNSNGIGGKEYAMDYAAKNGGITLEGIMKSQGIEMPTWDINDPNAMKAWEYASEIYAGQVSGAVRALIGTSIRPNSVWQTIELKRLMNNPDVTMIIVIDPVTLAETIVFRR